MAYNSQLGFHVANVLQGINVADANLFIQQYSETKECWFDALNLLDSQAMQVQFFAATILHTKVVLPGFLQKCISYHMRAHYIFSAYSQVKKNWSQLQDNEKEQLYTALRELLWSQSSQYGEKKVLTLPLRLLYRCSSHSLVIYLALTGLP